MQELGAVAIYSIETKSSDFRQVEENCNFGDNRPLCEGNHKKKVFGAREERKAKVRMQPSGNLLRSFGDTSLCFKARDESTAIKYQEEEEEKNIHFVCDLYFVLSTP